MKFRKFFVWLFVVGLVPAVLAIGPPDGDGEEAATVATALNGLGARSTLVRSSFVRRAAGPTTMPTATSA